MYQFVLSETREQFWDWCQNHNITCEYDFSGYQHALYRNVDHWRLIFEDEQLQTLIELRWSDGG